MRQPATSGRYDAAYHIIDKRIAFSIGMIAIELFNNADFLFIQVSEIRECNGPIHEWNGCCDAFIDPEKPFVLSDNMIILGIEFFCFDSCIDFDRQLKRMERLLLSQVQQEHVLHKDFAPYPDCRAVAADQEYRPYPPKHTSRLEQLQIALGVIDLSHFPK